MAILDPRQLQVNQDVLNQVLKQWDGLPIEDVTWELLDDMLLAYPHLHLKDKVFVEGKEWYEPRDPVYNLRTSRDRNTYDTEESRDDIPRQIEPTRQTNN